MVNALEAQGLAFAWPDESAPEGTAARRAVDGIDLSLAHGELACVIGPNGAGKSTLLRLLAGLCAPDSGRVWIEGDEVMRLAPRERARRVALVPQGLETLPQVTVETFTLGGRYGHLGRFGQARHEDHAAVRSALAEADAADFGKRLLAQLSGGQRQRVLLARALAQEARVLLVDEPTNSLDPEHQLTVFDLLARLCRESRAGLVVTHDLNLAAQYATRVLLLQAGRVVADGAPEVVLTREVLAPVYGDVLAFGEGGLGGIGRYVLPRRR